MCPQFYSPKLSLVNILTLLTTDEPKTGCTVCHNPRPYLQYNALEINAVYKQVFNTLGLAELLIEFSNFVTQWTPVVARVNAYELPSCVSRLSMFGNCPYHWPQKSLMSVTKTLMRCHLDLKLNTTL